MLRQIHRLHGRALLVGAALCTALSGCGTDEPSVGAPNNPEQPTESLSAGQIVAVVATINQGEVKQAQGALERLDDADVRAYAQRIGIQHAGEQAKLVILQGTLGVQQESSGLKTDIEQLGQRMNQSIDQESADRLAATFLDAQIAMHQKALSATEKLLSQTQDPELRTYLENFRVMLQQHLDQATRLSKRFPEAQSRR
jgi:predicted outer membrane protein